MEEKIEKLMKNLSISREEALELLADDKRIDKGEKLFELTPEQKKVAKKMTITTSATKTKVDAYGKKTQRAKKVDSDKELLVKLVVESLTSKIQNLEITNPEREINFTYNNRKFKIILSAPRK